MKNYFSPNQNDNLIGLSFYTRLDERSTISTLADKIPRKGRQFIYKFSEGHEAKSVLNKSQFRSCLSKIIFPNWKSIGENWTKNTRQKSS